MLLTMYSDGNGDYFPRSLSDGIINKINMRMLILFCDM